MAGQSGALALLAPLLVAGPALGRDADDDLAPEVLVEREQLIEKIARGEDLEKCVARFVALRAEVMGKREAAVAVEKAAGEERARRHEALEAYRKTADHHVSWRCTLSPDPANPVPSDEGRFRGDWGRVVQKTPVRLPPKNDLDEGEVATMVEVAGRARRYLLRAEKAGIDGKPLTAEKGDLVLVCDGGASADRALPPPFAGERVQRSGFAVRVAAPPKIAEKARWNPRHITGSRFYWAIREVKWKYPPEEFVLSHVEIAADLGEGRFSVETNNDLSWVLEVPPSLPRRQLIAPGRALWVIMGRPRFDRGLKKLVLVAEDVEERYVTDR